MARPASDIQKRIFVAARARFLSEGVDGASLRQIAKDASTNIGMVYYYYKTKDELFLAVIQDVYSGLLSDLERILRAAPSGEPQFAALYQRLSQMSAEEYDVIRLVMREALCSSHRLADLGQLFLQGHIPLLLGCISGGIQAQRLRGDLPPVLLMAASILLGILPQVMRRLIHQASPALDALLPNTDAIARAMTELLFHGIAHNSEYPALPDTKHVE
jgi:AcrR family transcriptional regulator